MKSNFFTTILVLIGIVTGGYFLGRSSKDCSIPNDKILVDTAFIDSLKKVINTLPDTTYIYDTLDTTIYRTIYKPAETTDSVIYSFRDSVITDTVEIYQKVGFNSKNKMFKSNLDYTLKIPTVEKTIIEKVPVPYEVEKIVNTNEKAWYFTGSAGIAVNDGTIVPSVGATYVTSNNMLYGASIGALDQKAFLTLTYGLKIK